jgi:hypothetical protein
MKKSENSKSTRAAIPYIAISRPWLIAVIGVLIVPWLTVFTIWVKPMSLVAFNKPPSATSTSKGNWGELTLVPIVISPPKELVFTDWGFMPRPTWFFPGSDADTVARMLQTDGVSAADAGRLRFNAKFESQIGGVVLTPDPAWVRGLSQPTRSAIYHTLAKSELNMDQVQAFRYPGNNPEAWLGNTLVSPRIKQLVQPLIYRDGNYMLFSDIELIRQEIGNEEDLRKLGKALYRQPTVIARLKVEPNSDLDSLVEYWGRGGRRTDIRPLLESVADGGSDRSVDVIHLLPSFAQEKLYTYPKLSTGDLDRPAVVNCLWTALNFFNREPDDRFLDPNLALKTLKEDYFVVESDFELGDIVAFLDEQGNIFHAAVYVADNLLFSKNGISAMAPWTFMSLDDVKGYYRWRCENPRLIYHRRKDL